jgi:hypothetical protein
MGTEINEEMEKEMGKGRGRKEVGRRGGIRCKRR